MYGKSMAFVVMSSLFFRVGMKNWGSCCFGLDWVGLYFITFYSLLSYAYRREAMQHLNKKWYGHPATWHSKKTLRSGEIRDTAKNYVTLRKITRRYEKKPNSKQCNIHPVAEFVSIWIVGLSFVWLESYELPDTHEFKQYHIYKLVTMSPFY